MARADLGVTDRCLGSRSPLMERRMAWGSQRHKNRRTGRQITFMLASRQGSWRRDRGRERERRGEPERETETRGRGSGLCLSPVILHALPATPTPTPYILSLFLPRSCLSIGRLHRVCIFNEDGPVAARMVVSHPGMSHWTQRNIPDVL
jgi:hypothetical protein